MLTENTRPCTGVAVSFERFKTVPTCVFKKTELKEIINWHITNTKQNFVAPDQINSDTS